MNHSLSHLQGSIHVAATADELYDNLASALFGAATRAVQERGVFHLALSGGSTPEPFYMRLVIDPRFRYLPWQQAHLWVVDERCVPERDPRSNMRMIRETLVNHVPVRQRQVHPVPVMEPEPDRIYEAELRRFIPDGRLDFVLLGMGDDAHTASLFPQSPAIQERRRWVVVNEGETVTPPRRVTMTYPLLNAARALGVLVVGEKKEATLRRVDEHLARHEPDPEHLPITGIQPSTPELSGVTVQGNGQATEPGTVTWYLDAAAAGADPGPEKIDLV